MLVSVVIPVYNNQKTIGATIKSVLEQTLTDFELLIVDDASCDDTPSIITSYAALDKRIKVLTNRSNQGVSVSRNRGCDEAQGSYIALLDADDLWLPQKLQKQVDLLTADNADICYTSYGLIDADGKPCGRDFIVPPVTDYQALLRQNVLSCSTCLLKAEVMLKHQFPVTYTHFHEDYVLWLELLRSGYRAVGLTEVLALYRNGGRSANKLNATKYRYQVYRQAEGLSVGQSLSCLIAASKNAWKKYHSK